MNITFRPLTEIDLSQLYVWINTDFVSEWWKPRLTEDEVKEKYSKYITGENPTNAYIIVLDGVDSGYIQTYLVADYPEYNEFVQADEKSAMIDVFIGHADFIHKGYGMHIMREFMRLYVFSRPDVDKCLIGPEPKNRSAVRMYEKSGFRWYKTVQIPDEEEPEHLMMLTKEDFLKII